MWVKKKWKTIHRACAQSIYIYLFLNEVIHKTFEVNLYFMLMASSVQPGRGSGVTGVKDSPIIYFVAGSDSFFSPPFSLSLPLCLSLSPPFWKDDYFLSTRYAA